MIKALIVASFLSVYSFQATFYHDYYNYRKTANGEVFQQDKLTAASNKFKFGTKVKVTNLKNKKSVIVRINDRGNFPQNHIDLSKAAFSKIGNLGSGRIKVKIEVIK